MMCNQCDGVIVEETKDGRTILRRNVHPPPFGYEEPVTITLKISAQIENDPYHLCENCLKEIVGK